MKPVNLTIPATRDSAGQPLPELVLRPPEHRDAAAIAGMMRDPRTAEWILVPVPFTDAHRDRYVDMARREWESNWPRWFVTLADNGTVLGTVGLRKRRHAVAEIIYQTAPWARGQYVALRAAHRACRFAFDRMDVERLAWDAIVGNHPSRLIARRLGFQMEGTARSAADQRGKRVDYWIGGLLPGELRDPFDPPADYPRWRRHARTFHRPQPSLETALPDLRLRPLRATDVDDITTTCRDPETARWTTVPQPYQRHHAEGFVADYAAGSWRAGTIAVFALADADDRYCGTIDLRLPAPDTGEGEIGFSTAPWARGRGYMTAALGAMRDFGFGELGLDRIVWKASVGNEASRRVAAKAGFTMEGTSRVAHTAGGPLLDTWFAAAYRGDE